MDPAFFVMLASTVQQACPSVLLMYMFALSDTSVLLVARKLGPVQLAFIKPNLDKQPVPLACLVISARVFGILASQAACTYALQDIIAQRPLQSLHLVHLGHTAIPLDWVQSGNARYAPRVNIALRQG